MSFKENLLKKIRIDQIAKKVLASAGPPDSGRKIDKSAMKELLGMGLRQYRRERDLDLYRLESDGNILVLDNDLAIYKTTPEDVALRKSPTVKEMISVRNVVKILNDGDVVISKKADSVRTIREECIALLDLSYDESDIREMEKDGVASLESGYTDGVTEALSLFGELLGYVSAPKAFRMGNFKVMGASASGKGGETLFGPVVLYGMVYNTLRLIDTQIGTLDKGKAEFVHQVAMGKEKASCEGAEVFAFLREAVMQGKVSPCYQAPAS